MPVSTTYRALSLAATQAPVAVDAAELLGREGGYFCSPDQGMPFPEEHIAALREEVESYGVYPLKPPEGMEEAPAA
mgnify:CR=1 FL=1